MESLRQKKFAKEMQRALSTLLQRQIEGLRGVMITVSHVRMTPDLQHIRAYITVYPDKNLPAVLTFLTEENKKVRYMLASEIKHQVRVTPTLEFFADDTLETATRLDELFDQIRDNSRAADGAGERD